MDCTGSQHWWQDDGNLLRHKYCESLSSTHRRLQELESRTRSLSEGQMVSGNIYGGVIRLLVQLTKAKRYLDLGTFTGYGALVASEASSDVEVVC